MKTSYKWLQDYVELPPNPDELAEVLTMAGLEVETIETIGDLPKTVVVAEIKAREPHPDADRLSVCQVDDGSGEILDVVCGAPNCDAGQKVPLARVGTSLASDFEVGARKVRGVMSHGMLCAADELGLGEDHSGLLVLPDDAPVGVPLRDFLGADTVIDWEVTPNRPDWLSHRGIAREFAAVASTSCRTPAIDLAPADDLLVEDLTSVQVNAPDLCPRYTARVITDITVGPSPDWMQDRLRAVGLRPVNNVVDITNYVLYECGQPLHAFDFDRLAGRRIIVRRAAEGEKMKTLDGGEHVLSEDHLLIADANAPVALAGVMGGLDSEILPTTTTVLLESAAFDPANIRATAKQLGLATDSSYRFERGADVEMVEWASARAASLICEYAGGRLAKGVLDVRRQAYEPPRIRCRYQRVNDLLGLDVPPAEVKGILQRLGLAIEAEETDSLVAAVPSFRLDLALEIDLIEEIGRVYGLDRIPAARPTAIVGAPRHDDMAYPVQALREELLGLGLNECLTYSLIAEEDALGRSDCGEDGLVRIKNPLSGDFGVLRPSLLPGMLRAIGHNLAHDNQDLRLFELGRTYHLTAAGAGEQLALCIALSGRRHPERYSGERETSYDFFDLRGLLEDMLARRCLPALEWRPVEHPLLAPGLAAELATADGQVGVLGEVSPQLFEDRRLRHPLFVALLRADLLLQAAPPSPTYQALAQHPSVTRDVAFSAEDGLAHQQVVEVIRQAGTKILEEVGLFDIFRDEERLGRGRKSMAYTLVFRAPDRTLTDKEVNRAHEKVRTSLARELGVELR